MHERERERERELQQIMFNLYFKEFDLSSVTSNYKSINLNVIFFLKFLMKNLKYS